MSSLISSQKSQLRQHCRALRKALGEETRARASVSICEQIQNWDVFQQSQVILTYMPIKSEADLTPLLMGCPQKRWILPRIIPEEDHRMVFHPYDANRLVWHPFGMAEPATDSPTIAPEEIELALVPGLAFDHHGWRLGYGGGYFDRFLKDFKGVSVGIVFHALLLDQVPHTRLDIPMQWIITEQERFFTHR
ncbi:MAG: 5-formyltetrahydrofolate cyclo-ligase [Chloroflexota bacterium]